MTDAQITQLLMELEGRTRKALDGNRREITEAVTRGLELQGQKIDGLSERITRIEEQMRAATDWAEAQEQAAQKAAEAQEKAVQKASEDLAAHAAESADDRDDLNERVAEIERTHKRCPQANGSAMRWIGRAVEKLVVAAIGAAAAMIVNRCSFKE